MLGIIITLASIGVTMIGVVMVMMIWIRSETNTFRTEAKEDKKELWCIVTRLKKGTNND